MATKETVLFLLMKTCLGTPLEKRHGLFCVTAQENKHRLTKYIDVYSSKNYSDVGMSRFPLQ